MATESQLGQDRASGSVWTSFADLWTAMSVIFLVMFIVAVLKLTLSTVETANTKEAQKKYLEGEIPASIQKEVNEKTAKVKNTITDIKKAQEAVNQRAKELNVLVNNMESHKKEIESLLKEQAKRDVLLGKVAQQIKSKKEESTNQAKTIQNLSAQLAKVGGDLENAVQGKKSLTAEVNNLQARLNQSAKSMDALATASKQAESGLKQQIGDLEKSVERERSEIANLQKSKQQLADENKSTEQKLKDKIAAVNQHVDSKNSQIKELEARRAALQQKIKETEQRSVEERRLADKEIEHLKTARDDLSKGLESTKSKLRAESEKVKTTDNQIAELKQHLGDLEAEKRKAEGMAASLHRETDSLNKQLESEKLKSSSLNSLYLGLEATLRDRSKEIKGLTDAKGKLEKQLARVQTKASSLENELALANGNSGELEKQKLGLEQQLKRKGSELADLSAEKSSLESGLAGMKAKADALGGELKSANNKIATMEKHRFGLENQLKGSGDELGGLAAEKGALEKELAGMKAKADALGGELKSAKNNIAGLEKHKLGLENQLKGRGDELGGLAAEKGGLEKELAGMKAKADALGRELGLANGKAGELEKQKLGLADQLKGKEDEIKGLAARKNLAEKELAQLKATPGSLKVALRPDQDKSGQLGDTIRKLENDLDNKSHKLAAALAENAQLKAAPPQIYEASAPAGGMRGTIGKNLSKRFKNMGLDVITDERTGSITLLLDDAFLFQHDSYRLRAEMIAKLNRVIPAYTDELFGDTQVRDNISAVNVIGHASPYYHGYVDPETAPYKAYEYNLILSSNRALEITRYIVGDKIANYDFKSILRRKVKASGKSFTHPLVLEKNEDNKKDKEECGIYSCWRSRRVEISFTLANEDENVDRTVSKMTTAMNQEKGIFGRLLNMFGSY